VTIGKAWELARPERLTKNASAYDLVIVDGPASGHGTGILTTPQRFVNIARVGPIARQAQAIHEMIVDPDQTGVVAVTLPSELPVNEVIELSRNLESELALTPCCTVINGVYERRFSDREIDDLTQCLDASDNTIDRSTRGVVIASLSEHRRVHAQQEQVARLLEAIDTKAIELPFLFRREFGPADFELLADRLERAL
jgi:anion-transporting  ArsA/GET3 family ATPase